MCLTMRGKSSNFGCPYFVAYVMLTRDPQALGMSTKKLKLTPKYTSKTHITMGQQFKATRAQLNNLGKVKNHQNPSVEDVFEEEDSDLEDDLLEHGFFFLDDGPDSEEASNGSDSEDEEIDEDKLDGLINEAEIKHFNAVLFKAQAMAVKAEREVIGEKPKWKQHYTGSSNCTLQYHAQKQQQLAATNQKYISSWFPKEKQPDSTSELQQENTQKIIEVSKDSDFSDNEENGREDNVDASLHWLFLGTSLVSFSK
jgi:hypothetical protein